ncbi:MAG: 2,3-bisphosphoglycerate-dependent phosphoglycerate mutase [Alphaproteobacteria bacterium]|nr:2,3-bisphosphoglycerate-dependent phosphoglycerate mutase [Alphaproteobacteria bacterium]
MKDSLVLVRHGQSEWNQRNLFTGWRDPDLTDKGVIEARWAGRVLKDRGMIFDLAFTSLLRRAQHTLDIILAEIEHAEIEIRKDADLNERDYGELSGLNKNEAMEKFGGDQVMQWRRSYDIAPPGGESLLDCAGRVIPFYQNHIWPELQAGRRVIVAAHGNSLRALIMYLESLSGEEILTREVATAAPIIYDLNKDGRATDRKELVDSKGRDDGMG